MRGGPNPVEVRVAGATVTSARFDGSDICTIERCCQCGTDVQVSAFVVAEPPRRHEGA